MTHPGGSFRAEELLEHASFLSGLARELVQDSHAAADVVQDAYAAALERPPREARSVRGWLAVVVSNLARNARRGRRHRNERERAVARPERQESEVQALERLDVQRALIELVMELPEEQRTVLYLRYYEGEMPSAIAARLGVPVKTIKARHTRALAALRARLDERSGGDRAAWVSALTPFMALRSPGAPAAGKTALLLKLGAALGAVAATWLVWSGLAESRPEEPARVAAAPEGTPSPATQGPVAASRESVPAASPAAPAHAATAVLTGTVRLREDDSPVEGVTVTAYAGRGKSRPSSAMTDREGRFRIEWQAPVTIESLEVPASDRTTAALRWGEVHVSSAEPTTVDLWVTRGATLEATVVDEAGAPVSGARVRAWCTSSFDPAKPCDRSAETARDGRFALEHLGEDFLITADAPRLVCVSGLRGRLAPGARASGLQLTMSEAGQVRGHVVDADGRPVPCAKIAARGSGSSSNTDSTLVPGVTRFSPVDVFAESDGSGAFVLAPVPLRSLGARTTHPEFLDRDQSLDPAAADNRIELDPGYSVRGRVSSWTGQPVRGAEVRVRSTGSNWREAVTDDDGRFELRALAAFEKAFVLVAAEGHALFARQPLVLGPGGPSFLDLRLEPPAPLAGRVRDAGGRPLAGALVRVEGERVLDYDGVDFGEKTTLEWALDANQTRTDDEGRFRFASLYPGRFQVRVSPADDPRLWTELEADAPREDLEVVLDRAQLERVTFTGRVLDAVTREPIRRFTVVVWRQDGSSLGTNHEFGPEADGRFRLPGFERGEYALDVQADGYAVAQGEARECREGETEIDVALVPACAVELVVRDAKGRPSSAHVQFEDLEGRALWIEWGSGSSSSAIAVDGEPQAVSGLPRAPVRLTATGAGFERTVLDLDLTVPPVAPIEIVMRPELGSEPTRLDLSVVVTDEPELAGSLALETARDAYQQGRIRFPETVVRLDFLDERGQVVGTGTITPLSDGKFRGEHEDSSSLPESSTSEGPVLLGTFPVRVRAVVARAEGCREERLKLELRPGERNFAGLALLRQGAR